MAPSAKAAAGADEETVGAEAGAGARELARDIKDQHAVVNRLAEDMQGAIMAIRMLPVSHVFQRFPRLVRDVARKLGKQVELVLEGEETEADKGMIEAAFASGAGKLRTMFCIVLPEAHVPLVKDITITAISLLGFSAMAGLVGGGGLGDLAYRYGYQRYNMGIMIACIAVLVVLVQIIQAAGDWYVNRIERRRS